MIALVTGAGQGIGAAVVDALDIEPFLIADAMADFSLDDHRFALDYAGRRCAVTMTAARLRDHLRPPADAAGRPAPPGTRCRTSGKCAGGGS